MMKERPENISGYGLLISNMEKKMFTYTFRLELFFLFFLFRTFLGVLQLCPTVLDMLVTVKQIFILLCVNSLSHYNLAERVPLFQPIEGLLVYQ